jgi:hypothetical protein
MFESGSHLTQTGVNVFLGCWSLTSICIPASVESIDKDCFRCCTSLVEVLFEPDAKLTRIGPGAFTDCASLRSLVLPAQLEIMACGVFRGCINLCKLIFNIPSRLKQLDLPPSEFWSLCIPDSVEIVFGGILKDDGQHRLLQFGRESCLMTLELGHLLDFQDIDRDVESDSFVRLSEGVLRRFRCQFEDL